MVQNFRCLQRDRRPDARHDLIATRNGPTRAWSSAKLSTLATATWSQPQQRRGLIPWARQQVERILYAQRGAASSKAGAVGGFLLEHNLEAIGDPARERNILQDQQFDRDHGGSGAGTVAPQFEFRFGK